MLTVKLSQEGRRSLCSIGSGRIGFILYDPTRILYYNTDMLLH